MSVPRTTAAGQLTDGLRLQTSGRRHQGSHAQGHAPQHQPQQTFQRLYMSYQLPQWPQGGTISITHEWETGVSAPPALFNFTTTRWLAQHVRAEEGPERPPQPGTTQSPGPCLPSPHHTACKHTDGIYNQVPTRTQAHSLRRTHVCEHTQAQTRTQTHAHACTHAHMHTHHHVMPVPAVGRPPQPHPAHPASWPPRAPDCRVLHLAPCCPAPPAAPCAPLLCPLRPAVLCPAQAHRPP